MRLQMHVARLEWRARLRGRPLGWVLLLIAAISVALAWLVLLRWLARCSPVQQWLCALPLGWASLLWMRHIAHASGRRLAGGWLAALPRSRRLAALADRLLGAALPLLKLLIGVLTVAALARGLWPELARVAGVCVIGLIAGAGWPVKAQALTGSLGGVDDTGSAAASLRGLALWPLRQAEVWLPARLTSRLALAVALALPMGISANLAVATLGGGFIVLYVLVLLVACASCAQAARHWLAVTPLPAGRCAAASVRLGLAKALQWVLLGAVLGIALRAVTRA